MSKRPPSPLVWFAVGGGALAWITQFVAGYALGLAQCDQPGGRIKISVHHWQLAFAAVGVVVALASLATAIRLFFLTRGAENEIFDPVARGATAVEPLGRIQFMAMLGMTVNPLAIAIIVMSGIGAPLLSVCHQS